MLAILIFVTFTGAGLIIGWIILNYEPKQSKSDDSSKEYDRQDIINNNRERTAYSSNKFNERPLQATNSTTTSNTSNKINKQKRKLDNAFQLEHSGKLKEAMQMYYKAMNMDQSSSEGKEAKTKYYELMGKLKCNEAECTDDDTADNDIEISRQDLLDKYRVIAYQHNKIINKPTTYAPANDNVNNNSYTPPYPKASEGNYSSKTDNTTTKSTENIEVFRLSRNWTFRPLDLMVSQLPLNA